MEIGDAAGDIHAGETFGGIEVVHNRVQPAILQHLIPKITQPFTATEPARRRDHHDMGRIELFGRQDKL